MSKETTMSNKPILIEGQDKLLSMFNLSSLLDRRIEHQITCNSGDEP
jgi:hypothetical protein